MVCHGTRRDRWGYCRVNRGGNRAFEGLGACPELFIGVNQMPHVIPLKGMALVAGWRRVGSVQLGAAWCEVIPGLSPSTTACPRPLCILGPSPPPFSVHRQLAPPIPNTLPSVPQGPGAHGISRFHPSRHFRALEDVGPTCVHFGPSFLATSGAMSSLWVIRTVGWRMSS